MANNQNWVKQFLTELEQQQISAAVAKAETTTDAEIIPMIVKSSSVSGHVWPLLFLLLSVLTYAIDFYAMYLPSLIAIVVWLPVSYGLARLDVFKRLLTSKEDLARQVELRAELEFDRHNLTKTVSRNALLIFVSLAEHRAVVLGDKTIAERLPKEIWHELLGDLITGIKAGKPVHGFEKAIEHAGQILTKHYPAKSSNPNEISNRLIIKN